MSVDVQVTIDDTGGRVAVQTVDRTLRSAKLKDIVGRSGTNHIKKHLRKVDNSHANKLGGKRSHFFAAAALATNFKRDNDGATVSIAHLGIRQRYYGGEIRPVNKKYLTIPARSEAYGKSASEFNDLEPMIRFRNGKAVAVGLMQRAQTQIRFTRKGNLKRGDEVGGGVMFWLVKSVRQSGDKSILPTSRVLADSVGRDASRYIDLQVERATANGR